MDLNGEKRIVEKLDSDLKAVYVELGKRFYEENKEKDVAEGKYHELFDKVKSIFEEKTKLEVKLLAKQGKRRCGNCQSLVALESRFCNMCGEKLSALPEELLKAENVPEQKKCSKCGTILEKDAVFCPNCGQKNA